MKTKNKMIILLSLLVVSTYSYGQLKIGDYQDDFKTAVNSSAFLDASSSSEYNGSDNVGKGLIFPRVDLTAFTFSYTGMLSAINYPTRFDGFVVYNTAESGVAQEGDTEGTLTRGFWYYENRTTDITGGTWKPLGSGVASSTPSNGDVKYEGGGLKYWDVDQWKPLSGQGLVPPTHDPNVTVGLTGGKTEIMVGETIALTSNGTGVIWHIAQLDIYAELVGDGSQLKGLAVGTVTVRATTADNRYNEFIVTVKSATNPDGSGNLTVGSNTYKTYTYTYPNLTTATWMVSNSREGTPSATYYNNNTNQVNGFYYTYGNASGACPTGWHLPTQAEWTSLKDWVNSNTGKEGANWWIKDAGSAFAGDYAPGWSNWGSYGYWWSAGASGQYFYSGTSGMNGPYPNTSSYWLSVRCVKN